MNSLQSMTDILYCYYDNNEKQDQYIQKIVKVIEILDLENEYPQVLLNIFANSTILSLFGILPIVTKTHLAFISLPLSNNTDSILLLTKLYFKFLLVSMKM